MKVDIVYTWVNGSDPEWNRKRLEKAKLVGNILPEANNDARFMDNDELKYSLRSIYQFAPWVNNIFIVTDNQIPKWLNTSHQKINLINHIDIFLDKSDLPTFSSIAIESQIHNIKELSEHFIYFNDDMFLGNYCSVEYFFPQNDLAHIFTSEIYSIPSKKFFDISKRPIEKRNDYQHVLVNTRKLMKEKYNKSVCFNIRHSIIPLLKSRLIELENIFKNELKKTSSNSFRTREDILLFYLFEYYAIIKRFGKTKYLKTVDTKRKFTDILSSAYNKFTFGYINLHENNIDKHFEHLIKSKPFTFCLNQTLNTPHQHLIKTKLFLENYFPEKSPFEK